jgi:hypothetical protein
MNRFRVLAIMPFFALILPGCLENPLFDEDYDYYESDPPVDIPLPGPPDISGSAFLESAIVSSRFGGTMTFSVRANNAAGVEPAYDIQAEIVVKSGSTQIGSASVYLGTLDANQWTVTSAKVPVNAYPSSVLTISLELVWWDGNDNMYRKQVNGAMLLKTPG